MDCLYALHSSKRARKSCSCCCDSFSNRCCFCCCRCFWEFLEFRRDARLEAVDGVLESSESAPFTGDAGVSTLSEGMVQWSCGSG